MRVFFVGINPHPGSYSRGIPFSNNKMFWYLLSRSGLIDEGIDELKDDCKLKQMYETKFNQIYKFGFLNLINRPTRDISELIRGEEDNGRKRVSNVIKKYEPDTVCFVGKVSYERFSGLKKFRFGWQDDIGASKSFVMHFPLRGKASVRLRDLRTVLK